MRTTNIGIFLIGFIVINKCASQTIEICELPEKDSKCSLRCKTKDYYSQPVTFSHPPNHDVGSCIPPNQCRSNYDRYDLTQKKIGNENITYFHIQKLNRTEDEGNWICSYGNRPSAEKYLTVHTRPENIDVTVNETRMDIMVNCSCYCVYPQENIRMEIEISNGDKKVNRRLSPLQSFSFERHNCLTEERTVIGTFNVQKEKWPGNFVDISCICTEGKLSHTQTENKRHFFLGVPKIPKNAIIKEKLSQSVVVRWTKSANGGSMQTFVVLYKELSSNVMQNVSLQEKEYQDFYNVTLEGLKPDTKYEVWIYAYNKNGNSSDSGPLFFTTKGKETEDKSTVITIAVVIPVITVLIVIIIVVAICFRRRKKRKETNRELNHTNVELLNGSEVERLVDKKDTSDKTLSESSRMNIENTKALIKRITQTGFVETRSYNKGISLLQDSVGILVYKGVYGDGRFTNAVHMLRYFTEKGYHPAVIHDITKWDEIVNVNVQMVLLVPDILNKLTIDKKLYERVYTYWEKMMGCVERGKTKVIMTCQSEVMNDIWFVLRDYDIFDLKYHIDLSDAEYKLTVEEKEQILLVQCNKNGIIICPNESDENYENANLIDKNLAVKISKNTISEIAKTENTTGFPQNSELFCKHRKYTALGKNFFLRPTKCVVEEIDNLKSQSDGEKKEQYCLLKKLWFVYPKSEMFDDENYVKALESLAGTYVDRSENGKYVLKHETIYVAVGLSIIKEEPEKVIKESNWNFFRYHIKSIKSKSFGDQQDDGTTFFITEEFNDAVTKRCLDDLTPASVCRYVRYVIECWPGHSKRILNAIQTKELHAQNREKYLDIIQKSCELPDEKGIFVQACMYGNILAIEELKNHFRIPDQVLDHCKEISRANLNVLTALGKSDSIK